MHFNVVAYLALVLLVLLLRLRTANAHANGLTSSTCANFRVHHGENQHNDATKVATLDLLLENGTITNCFLPQQQYRVLLHANGLIKGFLLQAVSGARLPSNYNSLPPDTTWGPCTNTMSHSMKRNKFSEELNFPITTRRNERPLLFRYTVVFSMSSFIEDQYVEIPCCSQISPPNTETSNNNNNNNNNSGDDEESGSGADFIIGSMNATSTFGENAEVIVVPTPVVTEEPVTTPPPVTPTTAELAYTTLPPLGSPVDESCGKEVRDVYKTFNLTKNGVEYNCTINRAIKQTECVDSCNINGQPVVCQIYKFIERKKRYTCVPITQTRTTMEESTNNIHPLYDEIITSGCKCFIPF